MQNCRAPPLSLDLADRAVTLCFVLRRRIMQLGAGSPQGFGLMAAFESALESDEEDADSETYGPPEPIHASDYQQNGYAAMMIGGEE